jgi:cell fate regulator YaaT (PSP1 superfamily)
MGCGSCGTSKNGLPGGCKDHGSCKSGGCNRLNTHDWLSLIPVSDFSKPFPIIEVSFNHGSRKEYFRTSNPLQFEKGDFVTVEGSGGYDVGIVSITGELVKLQMKKKGVKETSEEVKKVLHPSNEHEIASLEANKKKEKEMMIRSRVIARELQLDMKIAEVEIQADGKKATFFYTAEDRVDFRELIRRYAADFRIKIEMRQIGIRQEAAKVGGIGSCGRELCCSTWLNDFKSVSTTAARYQNLSINQTKLSGQCGRLKCCLNYELDTYMDALRVFPEYGEKIKTSVGVATLQKKDIFKNLMWYSYDRSNTLYPLTIERVKEIIELNKKGIFPEELQAVEVIKKAAFAEKMDFVDVVGQLSLKSLDKSSKKKKNATRDNKKPSGENSSSAGSNPNQNPNQRPGGNRPAQKNRPNPNQNPNAKPNQNPNAASKKPAQVAGQQNGNTSPQSQPNRQSNPPRNQQGAKRPNPNTKPPNDKPTTN